MRDTPRNPVTYPDPDVPVKALTLKGVRLAGFHRHADADWEFCYLSRGEALYRVGQKRWRLAAGDFLTIRPHEPHACVSPRGDRNLLMFHPSLARSLTFKVRDGSEGIEVDGVRIPTRMAIALPRRPTVQYLLGRIQEESFGRETEKRPMCIALLAQLLLELKRNAAVPRAAKPLRVSRFGRQIVEGLCGKIRAELDYPWTRAELVRQSGYSATHLNFLFERVTGMSPYRWLVHQRVLKAGELLAESDKDTVEIAADVGFSTRSQFHRAFCKVIGTSPARYRTIVRHEQ
ncbi:MAG: helix-turn-helix domain-containing protein [Planctomycetes bacterium]|nr:helix-turn-helix domain-containing protein [Planctomycetota bacterium]MBM4078845.1 helix-turn-helix domain-containing protein [Planctomycetota bacterium]